MSMLYARSEERPRKPSDRPAQHAVPPKSGHTPCLEEEKKTRLAYVIYFVVQKETLDWASKLK